MADLPDIPLIKVCVDANDPDRVAAFYAELLGYRWREVDDDEGWRHLEPPQPQLPPITIQPVPEGKAVKNRLHLDVFVEDPEWWIERAEGLGATRLFRSEDPDDWF